MDVVFRSTGESFTGDWRGAWPVHRQRAGRDPKMEQACSHSRSLCRGRGFNSHRLHHFSPPAKNAALRSLLQPPPPSINRAFRPPVRTADACIVERASSPRPAPIPTSGFRDRGCPFAFSRSPPPLFVAATCPDKFVGVTSVRPAPLHRASRLCLHRRTGVPPVCPFPLRPALICHSEPVESRVGRNAASSRPGGKSLPLPSPRL